MLLDSTKASASAIGNKRLVLFPRLRVKKIFAFELLVAVHNLQLELLDDVRELSQTFVVMNGNEAVPQQHEVDEAVDMATHAARYAVGHIFVSPPTLGQLKLVNTGVIEVVAPSTRHNWMCMCRPPSF
jgi:hypothetical protein